MASSRTSRADVVASCESILATLDAAELQLRVFAANELPFAAVARIHRNAIARSRQILAGEGVVSRELLEWGDASRRDEDTEELLHAALSGTRAEAPAAQGPQVDEIAGDAAAPVDLDDGPEGSDDSSMPIHTDEEEESFDDQLAALKAEIGDGSFVSFDEPASGSGGGAPLVEFEDEPTPLVEDDSLISFDDPTEADDLPPDEEPTGSRPALVEPVVVPDVAARRSTTDLGESLVEFDEPEEATAEEDLVQMDAFDDEPATNATALAGPAVEAEPPAPKKRSIDEVETFDLIPDASDDLHLEDDGDVELFEEEDPAAAATPAPVKREVAPRRSGSLDSSSEVIVNSGVAEAAAARVAAKADKGPKVPTKAPEPRVETKRGKDRDEDRPAARGASVATVGTKGRAAAAVPLIRDGSEPRPRTAAIQLNAQGGGKVLGLEEEEEALEMGEAEFVDDMPSEGGFSLQVEEYDYDDEDEEEEDDLDVEEMEEMPVPKAPPVPIGPSSSEIEKLLARAREAARAGENEQGIVFYSDVLDGDPDHVDAHIERGRLYLDLGDYARAMSDFTISEELAPESPEPQVAIGDLYFARKDYRKAIDYFNAALEMSPNHAMAYCRRGISHYYRKNYPDALADLQKAEQLDPDIPNVSTFVTMARKKAPGRR